MKEKESSVTWWMAVKAVWNEEPKEVGRRSNHSRLRSMSLYGAVISTFMFIFGYYQFVLSFSGDIPPKVPLLEMVGKFERIAVKQGFKNEGRDAFVNEDGKTYWIKDFKGLLPLQKASVKPEVSIQGFILRNGTGELFITQVKAKDGTILVNTSDQMMALENQRHPHGFAWFLSLISGALWLISIKNIFREKRKLEEARCQH